MNVSARERGNRRALNYKSDGADFASDRTERENAGASGDESEYEEEAVLSDEDDGGDDVQRADVGNNDNCVGAGEGGVGRGDGGVVNGENGDDGGSQARVIGARGENVR